MLSQLVGIVLELVHWTMVIKVRQGMLEQLGLLLGVMQIKTHGQGYFFLLTGTFISLGGVRSNIRPGRDSLPSTTEVTSDQGKIYTVLNK